MTEAEFAAKYPRLVVREAVCRIAAEVNALVYLHTGHRRGLVTWAADELPRRLAKLQENIR